MTRLEEAINTLEHISTTAIPASQMRRIIREVLLNNLYPERNHYGFRSVETPVDKRQVSE
jgi:hypothetical protein